MTRHIAPKRAHDISILMRSLKKRKLARSVAQHGDHAHSLRLFIDSITIAPVLPAKLTPHVDALSSLTKLFQESANQGFKTTAQSLYDDVFALLEAIGVDEEDASYVQAILAEHIIDFQKIALISSAMTYMTMVVNHWTESPEDFSLSMLEDIRLAFEVPFVAEKQESEP